nr:dnaJ homolog subfamily B member 13-like [Parasteatoda tepidariorum]
MGLDYYGLLDLNRNATDEDIKKEFRRLNNDPNSAKRFHDICEAYDVLRSPKWKALYDQFGEDGIKNGVPVPPGPNEEEGPIEVYTFHGDEMKVFRDFFGVDNPFADYYLPNLDPGYKFFEEPAKPIPGPDQVHTFELSLEDAFYGTTKSVGIPLQVVDETGTRTVEVDKMFTFRVPKGIIAITEERLYLQIQEVKDMTQNFYVELGTRQPFLGNFD